MILATLLRINWQKLKRDYAALALTFVLPIAFFSIFAAIFGSIGLGGVPAVLALDLDDSPASRRLLDTLASQRALTLTLTRAPAAGDPAAGAREHALARVRSGDYPLALVLPAGFGASLARPDGPLPVELRYDAADPSTRFIVAGLLQAAAVEAAPELLLNRALAPLPAADVEAERRRLLAALAARSSEAAAAGGELLAIDARDVRGPQSGQVAYYAAGIGVMFLLFSMTGAGSVMLQEQENGTLERLLTAGVTLPQLLLGNWLFFTVVGVLQVGAMFVWAALVFGLDLWRPPRLLGGLAMTLATATAAAAFGIFLATLCRSRAQLNGVASILVLLMSALGGSMLPRFVMPPLLETLGLFTLNGWAIDGFVKVFWTAAPDAGAFRVLTTLWPQLAALLLLTLLLLGAAMVLARRWDYR